MSWVHIDAQWYRERVCTNPLDETVPKTYLSGSESFLFLDFSMQKDPLVESEFASRKNLPVLEAPPEGRSRRVAGGVLRAGGDHRRKLPQGTAPRPEHLSRVHEK